MKPCTAVVLLPPPDFVLRLAVPGSPPESGHLLCELAERHPGPHAALLWDDDANRVGIWARWDGGLARLAELDWCPAADARNGDACGLFAGHPAAHDWAITDPTLAAVDALLADRHPHLFPGRPEGAPGAGPADGDGP